MKSVLLTPSRILLFLILATLGNAKLSAELIGPSSRRTGLVISEIMYHPAQRQDARNLEYVEIYNSEEVPADLSGFRLTGDIDYTFPTNTVLRGLGFLVVAAAPEDVKSVVGSSRVDLQACKLEYSIVSPK